MTTPSRKRSRYNQPMQAKDPGRVLGLAVTTLAFALGAGTLAQNPPPPPTPAGQRTPPASVLAIPRSAQTAGT